MIYYNHSKGNLAKKESFPESLPSKTGEAPQRAMLIIAQPEEKRKGHITMSTNEMTARVRELKELKAMADELAAEITVIEDEIKAEMIARNTDEITVDVYKIRWTKVLSNRFDTTAFKKAMPELAEKFMKQTESRRFSIA